MDFRARRIEQILESKRLFDQTYATFQRRLGDCWHYKYELNKDDKYRRTDTNASAISRVALDAYSSFLFTQGIKTIDIQHKSDPQARDKFLALAEESDLMSAIRSVIYSIINFDSHVMHIDIDKDDETVSFKNITPNKYAFARIDGVVTPIIYDDERCYYPMLNIEDDVFEGLGSSINYIYRDGSNKIGVLENDSVVFSWSKNSHYSVNMMNCRAFMGMGIEDEILEYKTALDTLMSLNAYPTMLVDSGAMISAKSVKPGQILQYQPNPSTPALPPLRRAIPDSLNLASENMEYIKYLKVQLQEIYMLDVVLKDDATAQTTAISGISSEIYDAVTKLVHKFLNVMVGFGRFRKFNEGNADDLTVNYHSQATRGSMSVKYGNLIQTIDLLSKLGQADENIIKSLDMGKIIREATTILGTTHAVAFNDN